MTKILFLFFFSTSLLAFEHEPKLTGNISISIKNGTIDANLQLENIPPINDYLIFLNSGFNIQYFRDHSDSVNYTSKKEYNANFASESFGYYFLDKNSNNKILPPSIKFKYTGKFPVIDSMDKASDYSDWKGNIAFNGKTVRADGLQTAWYPVIYDIKEEKRYESVTYDIQIICQDCRSIYVNGNKPSTATIANFKRDKAIEVALFAGDYDVIEHNDSYFLNLSLSAEQLAEFSTLTSGFKEYYQDMLSIPYGESLAFIQTTPTSKKDAWLYISYPTITGVEQGKGVFNNLFDNENSNLYKSFFAHEIAHYYFSTYRSFNSELGDLFNESFSEFFALKATKKIIDEEAYSKKVNKKLAELIGKKHTTIKGIKNSTDYGDRNEYVYTYAPIIWLAVEQEIGEKAMLKWLNKMLTTKAELTNYEFMLQTLASVLQDERKLNLLINDYFSNNNAIKKASLIVKH